MNLIERIDEARARWNVLDHPFYVRWERGELTRDELAFYAGEYRHAVVALAQTRQPSPATPSTQPRRPPTSSSGTTSPQRSTRRAIASRAARPARASKPGERDDALAARAVLYAVESGQPDVSRTKLTGLIEHYGFTADSTRARRTSSCTQSETMSTRQPPPMSSPAQSRTRTAW